MSEDEDALSEKMEKIACAMADKLTAGTEPSKEATDAFKALSTYFATTRKLSLKDPDGEKGKGTFGKFRAKIDAATN